MNITDLLANLDYSIRQVMNCIDRNARGIALVVDDQMRLLATVTDGDVRRAILAGLNLDASITKLLTHKKSNPLYHSPIVALSDTPEAALLAIMQKHGIQQLPLVDDADRVIDIVGLNELAGTQQRLPLQAVVMAGGLGTRLRPLTEDVPKPMLPVGDKPLLEHILSSIRKAGITQANVTTHYKPEMIEQYFGDGKRFGIDLAYVNEDEPLGTAGALSLLEAPQEPLLVINGDILTAVDFRAMLKFHQQHHAALTVAVRQYDVRVPYGVLDCDGHLVKRLSEKPVHHYLVNAGIYLLAPAVFHSIPRHQRFDMTDLIELLIENGNRVVSFPVIEYWLDIGQHKDYMQAQEDVVNGRVAL